ncbi:subtilisin-like protein, partial [Coniophora puteana RWD-64-598 SS2]
TLTLQFALSRQGFGELEQHLMEISDSSHTRYGMHLSKDEVHELMAPHPETQHTASEWLAFHGLDETNAKYSSARDSMTLRVPVGTAESMFNTSFHVYKHAESGNALVQTTHYSLPEVLHDHIDLVHPLVMLASAKTLRYTAGNSAPVNPPIPSVRTRGDSAVDPSCNTQITPDCLRQLYNIGNYTSSSTIGNGIAVSAFEDEWASYTDYETFLEAYASSAAGSNFSVTSTKLGTEASLDVQYAFGLTRPIPATFFTIGGYPDSPPDMNWTFATGTLDFVDFLLNQTDLPPVISTSYGEDETSFTPAQANTICQGFAALGARGVSILYSSGDYGVGYDSQDPETFTVHFPASCPYVTSVGMTSGTHEVAGNYKNESFSGGGFSSYFPRPSYQDKSVSDYLTYLGDQYSGLYNSSGRGYPDVSAQGVNFPIDYYGGTKNETGTSASTPTFAAIIALLNDVRLSAGKGTLGFLNPWLYSSGYAALNDITEGNNPGAGTLLIAHGLKPLQATRGWDPLTGLGTPDFARLK